MRTRNVRQYPPALLQSKDDQHTLRPLGPLYAFDERQLYLQDLAVKEKQRAQRQILFKSGNLLICRQVRQVSPDFIYTHLARMPLAMIKNEATNYLYVIFLGADAIMLKPDGCAHLFKKRRLRRVRNLSSRAGYE